MNTYVRYGVLLVIAFVWVYGGYWLLPMLGLGSTATFAVVLVGAVLVGRLVQQVFPADD